MPLCAEPLAALLPAPSPRQAHPSRSGRAKLGASFRRSPSPFKELKPITTITHLQAPANFNLAISSTEQYPSLMVEWGPATSVLSQEKCKPCLELGPEIVRCICILFNCLPHFGNENEMQDMFQLCSMETPAGLLLTGTVLFEGSKQFCILGLRGARSAQTLHLQGEAFFGAVQDQKDIHHVVALTLGNIQATNWRASQQPAKASHARSASRLRRTAS